MCALVYPRFPFIFSYLVRFLQSTISPITKERSRRYPTQTIMEDDYANYLVLLANTPAQAESLLYSLERAAAGIGLYVNAH